VKIKTAIQKLKQDIKAMDLRAGVLSHTVMQHKVREKRNPGDGASLARKIFLEFPV